MAQKAEKRARTRTYRIIHPATGSYIPLFSQGLRICLSPPCTDEPRLKLTPGDTVKVTRWRKHWLFGERVPTNENNGINTKKKEIRGWFPRRCAVELDEPGNFDEFNDKSSIDNEKKND